MVSHSEIKENVLVLRKRLGEKVCLVAVTKTINTEKIRFACDSGIKDIGENKVQEAAEKYPELKDLNLTWHLVGRLQTNKVKKALEIFDLIHSVDSLKLAEFIAKEAEKIAKIQKVLLQVNISREVSKGGFSVEEIFSCLEKISLLKNIKVCGLMTIGANTQDEKTVRSGFVSLRRLLERINETTVFADKLEILSMGMSNDYQIALEEGANLVRIGKAIFGERNS